uniref:Uncharacterized protein n=1 Tax=Pyramimonas obovata TaxID=1411642 RepID=A0A7S0WNF0_9CHLO|mmetsp:Transcript_31485/g.68831  ORF Transcript_31485/g.68831 Transcript_31485/m.68831 type:complete len:165 (+) Transcript_31485:103-597(+)|eukprot:CAMPEP_0118933762 /NCGR_PEP_ID=MMETSP1169-20130426/12398_1 /TAXON_ID=36882 /ORGANISM="Pyramimonas obovata, Strain CCMP722" /LENGTH=164 /DNA_ID=CAMNT_0006876571 /DNA_START=86 /DNA_END=580 /DNA_ORIENTATION=+
MGKIKDYFVEQGLTVADIPKAIVLHEVVSIGFAAATWMVAYQTQPGKTLAMAVPADKRPKFLVNGYKAAMGAAKKQVEKTSFLKRISDPERLTVSCAESICFRGIIKPVTVPGKLWAAWKLTLMTKSRAHINKAPKPPSPASMTLSLAYEPTLYAALAPSVAHR